MKNSKSEETTKLTLEVQETSRMSKEKVTVDRKSKSTFRTSAKEMSDRDRNKNNEILSSGTFLS